MIFDRNEKKEVIALLGAGSMGTAIVRRIAAGRKILLGDISEKNLEKLSHDFKYSGYDVETMIVNALDKSSVEAFAQKAASLGDVKYFIDTAGASPNQAKPEHILALDMVGTGYAVDAFGEVMAKGGAGLPGLPWQTLSRYRPGGRSPPDLAGRNALLPRAGCRSPSSVRT